MPHSNNAELAYDCLIDHIKAETSRYLYGEDYFVLLTEELAKHIVQMYNDTDWMSIGAKDVNIPDDIFTGEMDEEKWMRYVGKHILVSRDGDPWPTIREATTFEPGVRIELPEDLMQNAASYLYEVCDNDDLSNCLIYLSSAIYIMLKDGLTDNIIKALLTIEYEKYRK